MDFKATDERIVDQKMNDRAVIKLKKGEGRYLKAGGAWVFDNEIDEYTGSYENGDIISLVDFDGYPPHKMI